MASSSQCLPKKGHLFFCRFCCHPFYSQHRLETHERIHTGNKPHQCPLCCRAFTQAMYLRFHLEQIHGGSQEDAEVMVHSVSTSTVLDAVNNVENVRSWPLNTGNNKLQKSVSEVGMRTLPFGRSSTFLDAVVNGENNRTQHIDDVEHYFSPEGWRRNRPLEGSNNIHQESSNEPEEGGRTQQLDRRSNIHQELSPEHVGDIMDFAPLFLAEDIPITAMTQPASSINADTSDECHARCSPTSSSSSQDHSNLPVNIKDIASSDHLPINARDTADSDHMPIPAKDISDSDHFGVPVPRKIRKQQTPQKTILDDDEGIVTEFSSAPESTSDMDAEKGLERNLIFNDVTGIMALRSKSPPCWTSTQVHERVQPPCHKDRSDAIYHTPSSCQATPFQDAANHESSSAEQVLEAADTFRKGNTSLTCQSKIHDTQIHLQRNQSGAVVQRALDTPTLLEGNFNETSGILLPEMPRKKKILTCELCDKTFTGTLFLRSHFRVVHGAEIIGIDSDDDCSIKQEKTEQKCEINSSIKVPMSQEAEECDVSPKPVKRSRGRPKGSKNKLKGSKESLSVEIGNSRAKVRAIIKHSTESSNSKDVQIVHRKRGRPPKNKVQMNSAPLHGGLSKSSKMLANMPHVPSPQSITNSVIDTLMIQRMKFSNEELEPFIENNLKKERKNPDDLCGAVKCNTCEKEFVRKTDLRRHMRSHTGEQPFACSTCGRKFAETAHLRDHERLHSDTKEYVCKVCGMRFAQSGGLYSHSRTHEKRQYGCKVCSKKFTRKSDVQRHLRTHTNLKPFRCDICDQSFSSEHLLKDHAKLHSEDRLYVCSECGMRFAGRNGLHSHFKIHVEKQYECEVCFKKFSRNSAWHRHMKTHF